MNRTRPIDILSTFLLLAILAVVGLSELRDYNSSKVPPTAMVTMQYEPRNADLLVPEGDGSTKDFTGARAGDFIHFADEGPGPGFITTVHADGITAIRPVMDEMKVDTLKFTFDELHTAGASLYPAGSSDYHHIKASFERQMIAVEEMNGLPEDLRGMMLRELHARKKS